MRRHAAGQDLQARCIRAKWGQNWGIPLYDWDALRRRTSPGGGERVRGVREFFDLFRIDHVLGFYRIYGFPWRPEENATFLPLIG